MLNGMIALHLPGAQQQAAFDTMLNAHSVNNFEHPRLATVPLLGSLLSNCLLQRGVGRGNGRGSTPDDMFPALLAAGADPNARNSAGVSCTHMAVAAVCYAAMQTDDRSADVVSAVVRRMLCAYALQLYPTAAAAAHGLGLAL